MGFMPHSLEKGTIGLRLDYLAQFRSVREHVRERLDSYVTTKNPNGHPIKVLQSVGSSNRSIEVEVNVLGDEKAVFVKKLNYLFANEFTLDPSWSHVGDGPHYVTHDSYLHEYNQDSTGNRLGFMAWWTGGRSKDSGVFDDIANAIVSAIDLGTPRLEFWWDCSLADGVAPTAEVVHVSSVARVLFRTDHSAVAHEPLPKRPPIDSEPGDPTELWTP
jgi:hypothetical protein